MELISKADLAEELNRVIKSITRLLYLSENRNRDLDIHLIAKVLAYNDTLDFINTLEVKEVDLETELSNYIEKYRKMETDCTMLGIARHFFNLGLNAKKGE